MGIELIGAGFGRELADHFPDAKLLLSVRDADRWYHSVVATIYEAMRRAGDAERRGETAGVPEVFVRQGQMARRVVFDCTFGGELEDRAHAIDVYLRHDQAVRDAFAGTGRLLEFEASQGWDPLCAFLGKPVPGVEFPRVIDTASFRERFGMSADAPAS